MLRYKHIELYIRDFVLSHAQTLWFDSVLKDHLNPYATFQEFSTRFYSVDYFKKVTKSHIRSKINSLLNFIMNSS